MKSIGILADEVVLIAETNKVLADLVKRLRAEVEQLQQAEAEMVADVKANGGSMPANHWQPRRQAEMRLNTVMALHAIVREVFK